MTNLTTTIRATFTRDEETTKRDRGEPHNELALVVAEIYLHSFAPKQAHDFVTLSEPRD